MSNPDYSMERGPGAKALLWFQRFVWLGIFANIVITLTAIFCTEWVIDVLRLDPAFPLAWPRFGAFGILLISGFYVIAAMDPCRSMWASVFTIVCRAAGLLFFAIVGGRYIVFGLYDLLFGAPQAICLYLAWRKMKASVGGRASGTIVAVVAGLLFAGAFAWGTFRFVMQPILPEFASDEEYFKYGSIGNDGASGIPYPLLIAMQDVCARHPPRPQGYAALGVLYQRGRQPAVDTPQGFSPAKGRVERA